MYIPKNTNFLCVHLSLNPPEDFENILLELGFSGGIKTINGFESLLEDMTDETEFHYIILDSHDDEDLHKSISQVKEMSFYSDQPIIVLNTISTKEVMQDCLNAGASDYIIKPFTKEILATKIIKSWK
ncbi:MAG: hypothetical protein VX341_00750 [Bdellovibrionota bacterium]|nr:hypothetical protein [Bdellovibrionota bacterium]